MKNSTHEFTSVFHLRPKQRLAVLILCGIILSVYIFPYLIKSNYSFSEAEREEILNIYLNADGPTMDSINRHVFVDIPTYRRDTTPSYNVFYFDPNTVDSVHLLKLGFSRYVTQNMLKYRRKGGRFYKSEDLQKIYGMDDLLFRRVEEYIQFEQEDDTSILSSHPKRDTSELIASWAKSREKGVIVENSSLELDLNLADSASLRKLKGIGSVFASRIIKYRARLGGFYSIEQLKEVYGFPIETFHSIQSQIYISEPWLQLSWNTMEFKDLLRHPYVDYETTKLLKNYKGNDPKGFLDSLLLSGKISQHLSPYLKAY